ncbi:hypothetical protein RHGRI_030621 [Rhododendron griersonianum]|uniref:Uncharacterized protein n=1 Tax=Rhododendron griersonianum TaxID=479676 RepID=A0AAV6I851_9ERIC|nr:hypothetical protein RHGRI_030621 [Rhododendron griersonianum]
MADKQPVPEMEGKPEEKLTPELVMYAMSLIGQVLYEVKNEQRHEVHPRSCLTGVSDPLMLTHSDIAEFFEESEGSGNKTKEAKTPDSPKDTPEKTSK